MWQLALTETRLQRTAQSLREARANAITGGPEGVLARAEEELRMNEYLSQSKLPQALEERQTLKTNLQRIVGEPIMTPSDLDSIHQEVCWVVVYWNFLVLLLNLFFSDSRADANH